MKLKEDLNGQPHHRGCTIKRVVGKYIGAYMVNSGGSVMVMESGDLLIIRDVHIVIVGQLV